jgi:hypothetical protein
MTHRRDRFGYCPKCGEWAWLYYGLTKEFKCAGCTTWTVVSRRTNWWLAHFWPYRWFYLRHIHPLILRQEPDLSREAGERRIKAGVTKTYTIRFDWTSIDKIASSWVDADVSPPGKKSAPKKTRAKRKSAKA